MYRYSVSGDTRTHSHTHIYMYNTYCTGTVSVGSLTSAAAVAFFVHHTCLYWLCLCSSGLFLRSVERKREGVRGREGEYKREGERVLTPFRRGRGEAIASASEKGGRKRGGRVRAREQSSGKKRVRDSGRESEGGNESKSESESIYTHLYIFI